MRVPTPVSKFREAVAYWESLVARPAASPVELAGNLRDLYRSIYGTDFGAFDVAEVRRIAQEAMEEVFDLSLRLRDRMPEWQALGLLDPAVAVEIRNAIRIMRYTCDLIGEVGIGYQRLPLGAATLKGFDGPEEWTLMHPRLAVGERHTLAAGDVLLVRGQLHNSAAIARIGDTDSQFSHIGLIHLDEHNVPWVVEALIEDGASVTPIDKVLTHNLVRAVVFRHRDRDLAARAARVIHDRVASSRTYAGRLIPYDFTMQLDGDDELFCSKLVRQAYRDASGGKLKLPSFPTQLNMKNRDFLERIGVTANETFAPGDIELEPAFEVVAEWRDLRATATIRIQDLIMSKLFDWMDAYGYQFEEDATVRAVEVLGGIAGILPDFMKDAIAPWVPKVPSNMMTRTVGAIAMLHRTAQPILEKLVEQERKLIAETGRPMHPRDVQHELETIRAMAPERIGHLVMPRA